MYIRVPFMGRDVFGDLPYIDTVEHAFAIVEGPPSDQLRLLTDNEASYRPMTEPMRFETPGIVWDVFELVRVVEHSFLVDTWWIWAIATDPEYRQMEVCAIWSPENRRHCYLARYGDFYWD